MNCYNVQNSRIQLKYSTIPGVTPTIPTSNDHTDGTWNPTDIYISELFFNVADNTLFTRSASGIIPITSGTTSIDVTAFVNLTGGTMSGGLFTPYLSATTASATTIYSPHFEGVFYGDGSNLTGITATIFTGGTVSGNTTFTGNVDMCAANLTVQNIDTCGGAINITSDLLVNGGISATTFTGDGSGLTNITATNDTYVTGGTYTNGTATFTNNTGGTFNVSGFKTDDLVVTGGTYNNGTATFRNNTGGTFNVSGFKTDDLVVTGGTYNNGTATFRNNTGGTFNVTGFTTGQTLEQTLVIGNQTGDNNINSADGYGIQFIDGTLEHKLGFHGNYVSMLGRDTATSKLGFVTTYSDTAEVELSSNNLSTSENTSISLLPDEIVIAATSGGSDYSTTMTTNQYESILRSSNISGNLKYGQVRTYTTPTIGSAALQAVDNVNSQIADVTVDIYLAAPRIFSSVSDGVTSKVSGIQQFADEIIVNGDISSFAGVEYFNDYSVNFTNRSLVDKEYVDTTVSNNTFTGGSVNNISANSISATTYYNLPTDIRVTGGTYSTGTATFTNNTGGTFSVSGFSTGTSFTGGTVTGATNFTGGLTASTISATTISATTIYVANMPELPFADGTTLDTYDSGGNTFLRLADNVGAPSGGTRTFSGNTRMLGNLTASTVSATTYYGDGSNLTGIISGGVFTGTTLSNMQWIEFNTTATTTHSEGRIHWNDSIKSLEIDTENPNVQIQVGHQNVVRVNNQTGAPLTKGTVVYINGEQGQRPTVTKADWTTDASSASVIGLVMADINNGANGYVITNGILEGMNTIAYSAGTSLYLYTGGTFTSTKPLAPYHDVRLGKVIVSNATTGSIYINVQNGYELEELHDVKITGVTNGDLIVYNSGTTLWENTKTLNGNYTITGSLSVPTISATTISASTIYVANMPELPFVDNTTIDSYTSGVDTFIRLKDSVAAPSGGTRTFTGNVNVTSGLTATTISATTYLNLPTTTTTPSYINSTIGGGYLLNNNASKAYKLTVPSTAAGSQTNTIQGQAITVQKMFARPGTVINEIAFRINVAGAAGTGLAQCRILIYRSKLDVNGNLIGGDLELDTNVNISTLTTGLKVVTGLNHTLSNNTVDDIYYIGIRNYQSGALSLKFLNPAATPVYWAELANSSTTMFRDMSWLWTAPYANDTPTSMPSVSAAVATTTAVQEFNSYIAMGYASV